MPHHVTQRAAHGAHILRSDHAKAVLVDLLAMWAARTGVSVGGFALMNNHFHLCATPPNETALSRMVGRATAFFSRWLNTTRGTLGPNWQGCFYAAPMDPEHTIAALRYVERNPVAAGLVDFAQNWRWSSAAWHCGLGPRPKLLSIDYRPDSMRGRSWTEALRKELDGDMRQRLSDSGYSSTPLGSEDWIGGVEAALGRPIRPRRRGRPSKQDVAAPGLRHG